MQAKKHSRSEGFAFGALNYKKTNKLSGLDKNPTKKELEQLLKLKKRK